MLYATPRSVGRSVRRSACSRYQYNVIAASAANRHVTTGRVAISLIAVFCIVPLNVYFSVFVTVFDSATNEGRTI